MTESSYPAGHPLVECEHGHPRYCCSVPDCKGYVKYSKENEMKETPDDLESVSTERSDAAEQALFREYQYHMLRAEELKEFLRGCGMGFDGD